MESKPNSKPSAGLSNHNKPH